jgi:hypothetical protein
MAPTTSIAKMPPSTPATTAVAPPAAEAELAPPPALPPTKGCTTASTRAPASVEFASPPATIAARFGEVASDELSVDAAAVLASRICESTETAPFPLSRRRRAGNESPAYSGLTYMTIGVDEKVMSRTRRIAIVDGAASAAPEIATVSAVSVAACCGPLKRPTSTLVSETAILTIGRDEGEGEFGSSGRNEAVEVPDAVAVADAVAELDEDAVKEEDAVAVAAPETLGIDVAVAELEDDAVEVAMCTLSVDEDVPVAVAEEDEVGSADGEIMDEYEVIAEAVAETAPLAEVVKDVVGDVDDDCITERVPEGDVEADDVVAADAMADDDTEADDVVVADEVADADIVAVRVSESVAEVVTLTDAVALAVALEEVEVVALAVPLAVPLCVTDGETVVVADIDAEGVGTPSP